MIYLDGVLLPITPDKLDMKINNKNKSIDLASGQEINIIKEVGLTTIALDVLLPEEFLPFAKYDEGFKPPQYYLRKFDEMKIKPFQFIFLRPGYNTNLTVTLEGYRIIEDARKGTVVKIDLKQYVHFGERTIKIDRIEETIIIEEEKRTENPPEKYYIYTTTAEDVDFKTLMARLINSAWRRTFIVSIMNGIEKDLTPGTQIKIPREWLK